MVVVVVVAVVVLFVIVVGCGRSGYCVNPTTKRPRTDLQREFGEFGHVTVRTSGVKMVVFWLWGILVAIPELCKNMQRPFFLCNDVFRHPTETTLRTRLLRISGCKFKCESHPPQF